MNNNANQETNQNVPSAATANPLLTDIRAKWSKFSEIELNGLKSVDDLTALIAAKYTVNPADARKEAEAVVNDRAF